MAVFLIIFSLSLIATGLLAFCLPARWWRRVMPQHSFVAHQPSVAGAILFGGLGLSGIGLIMQSARDCLNGWQSQRWVSAPAIVISSRVAPVRQIRSTSPAYRADVRYQYHVNGRSHMGWRTDFGSIPTTDKTIVEEEITRRFSPGAALTIAWNPRDPGESVIDRGTKPLAIILSSLGIVWLLIAVWQWRALLRDWRGDSLIREKSSR